MAGSDRIGGHPGLSHVRSEVALAGEQRPEALDLCVGLGGWAAGLIAEGWRVIGVDIEDMFAALGEPKPDHFELVLQDMRDVKGADYAHVSLIVGSSPCPDFSYRAMPWTRARKLTGPFLGIKLFHEQFRIQREASAAKGEYVPMVVENVRGAIPWVGRSRYNFGSYHLWGDVPALMPQTIKRAMKNGHGGSWFGLNPDGSPGALNNARDGQKVPGFRFDGSGRSFQSAAAEGIKNPSLSLARGADKFNDRIANFPPEVAEGRKGAGAGAAWFDANLCRLPSASPRRKAASAKIAKIPIVLSRHIGRVYLPRRTAA